MYKMSISQLSLTEGTSQNSPWGWIITYSALFIFFGVMYYLLQLDLLEALSSYRALLSKLCIGGLLSIAVVIVAKLFEHFLVQKTKYRWARYNLHRLLSLLTFVIVAFILISVLFVNWYTAAVSLGLISLILGFALQKPMSSFIGWIYLVMRNQYKVGDRIKINGLTGDVVEINYLDTTLWEFGGDYLTTDHPSGRVIKFPNSMVLDSAIYNYSWELFPFVWNEIPIYISMDSDVNYVQKTLQEVAATELGEQMREHVRRYRALLSQTPLDHMEIREDPTVLMRVHQNSWLEMSVRYLVDPRETGRVRTRLLRKILNELNKQPDKIKYAHFTNPGATSENSDDTSTQF